MTTRKHRPRPLRAARAATATMALGMVLATSVPSAQADGPAFKATYSGHAAFTGSGIVGFDGQGVGTWLGAFDSHAQVVITGPDASCPGGLANIRTETLTAADGSQLTFVSNDVACPTGPGTFHGTGTYRVTGGTKRLASASGQGLITGDIDLGAGTFVIELTGSVR